MSTTPALPKLPATRLVRSGWSGVWSRLAGLARSGRVPGIASSAMRRLGLRTLFELRVGLALARGDLCCITRHNCCKLSNIKCHSDAR